MSENDINKSLKKDKTREEMAKNLTKRMNRIDRMKITEQMVKDNKIPFEVEGIKYRIRKLTHDEQVEMKNKRSEKYLFLLRANNEEGKPKYIFKDKLILEYMKRGINILEMKEDRRKWTIELKKLQFRLAELGKSKENKEVIALKLDINGFKEKIQQSIMEETELLNHCIEEILMEYVNIYTTYLALEKLDKNKWVKAFKSFNDFMKNTNEELFDSSIQALGLLIAIKMGEYNE